MNTNKDRAILYMLLHVTFVLTLVFLFFIGIKLLGVEIEYNYSLKQKECPCEEVAP